MTPQLAREIAGLLLVILGVAGLVAVLALVHPLLGAGAGSALAITGGVALGMTSTKEP